MTNDPRYQKHYQLKHFGRKGQEKLAQSKILIVGAGGLGTPAAQYLNSIGVGTLGLVDQDKIALTNLARQSLYCSEDVGKYKISTLVERLRKQNPQTKFIPYLEFLTPDNALEIIADYDVVIDASDNFGTRYLVNDACVILDKPFIYGAVHDYEGHVSTFNHNNGPTYRCLFPETKTQVAIPNCDQTGVLGPLPGLIGTYQAVEAIKVITGTGIPLSGKLMVIDVLTQTHLAIQFPSVPQNRTISNLNAHYSQPMFPSDAIPEITMSILKAWVEEQRPIKIIDVREPHAFQQSHFHPSENIPISAIDSLQNFQVPLVMVCQSGKRSAHAAQQLKRKNAQLEVYNLIGGLNSLQFS